MENQFDLKASSWDENQQRVERAKQVADVMVNSIPISKSMNVLEYGCGTGLLGFNLISLVSHITFCDSSTGMLDQVEKKIEQNSYTNASVLNTDFSQETSYNGDFDLIFTMLTLHHVANIEAIMASFAKALTSGGYLCIVDLDEEDGSFHNDDTIPHLGFSKLVIEDEISKSGLYLESYKIATSIEKETVTGKRSFDVFMAVAKK